jgi:predicted HicB family RNase H-like nuclease
MDKQEWIKHCKWLNTFRGTIVTNNEVYKNHGEQIKNEKKIKKKKKNS